MKKPLLAILLLIALVILGGCAQEMGREQEISIDAYSWAMALNQAGACISAELNDNYASYFTADEMQMMVDELMGSFAGVGVYLNQEEDGRVRVVSVMPDRPAQKAGVEAGDIILSVDRESVVELDIDQVVLRLRGDEGTEVVVGLLREGATDSQIYEVTVIRALIESESLQGELLQDHEGIAYIQIYDFTEQTPRELYDLLLNLNQQQILRGLILDLRTNGGGSFNAAIKIAGFFVPKGQPVVWEKTYRGQVRHDSQDGALAQMPVVCLQDAYTASASEVLIGALRDYDIATIIGGISYGKGITQLLDMLPDGGGLRYTRSRYYTPQHYDLHGKGLEPDIEVEMPQDISYEEYFDPYNENNIYIQKALAELYRRLDMGDVQEY